MKFNDIRVARKLWATLLGLLIVGMAVAGFTLNRSGAAMDKAIKDVEFFESMITLALKWQNLSTTNNERALALLMVNDELTVKLFQQRMAAEGPAAVLVHIDPKQTYFPKITSRVTESGSMESNPLHRMTPDLPEDVAAKVGGELVLREGVEIWRAHSGVVGSSPTEREDKCKDDGSGEDEVVRDVGPIGVNSYSKEREGAVSC